MTSTLACPSIAILVANGFDESHITAVQRALTKAQLTAKMIASEQGLVNGWQDNAWGHYFTVDEQIGSVLGSDYDVLILVGGERGTEKLKTNPHTRRIVNHFLEAEKPVAAIGSGVGLLALSPACAGLPVSSSADVRDMLTAAQAEVQVDAPQTLAGVVLTSDGTDIEAWVADMVDLASNISYEDVEAAAA